MTHDDERSTASAALTPSSPVAFGDPTLDREALSAEERRALSLRRLSSSDWLLAGIVALSLGGTALAAVIAKGPSLDEDAERPRVEEVVLRHQLAEAARFVDVDESLFCIARADGSDPAPILLERFAGHLPPVLPVSGCYLADPQARSRKAWLFTVGDIHWRWTGDVEVLAGAGQLARYTLRRQPTTSGSARWRVTHIEPLAR